MQLVLLDALAGAIERVFLTIPAFATRHYATALTSAIGALPIRAEVDVLVSESARDTVAPWFDDHEAPVRLHPAPDDLNFSHWAQDALVAARDPDGQPRLVASRAFDRYQDLEAARLLASAAGLPLDEVDVPLDGGNLLAVGDRLLHGADLVVGEDGFTILDPSRRPVAVGCAAPAPPAETRPAEHLPSGWQEQPRAAVPEGSHQPLFHIDLFVAPAGPNRFLVGCPRLGAEALGLPLLDHADAERFDEVAALLAADGAQVVRNPQPLIWLDHVDDKTRTWLHLPVNNVLVEDAGPGQRVVWLPSFAHGQWAELAPVERANRRIWRDLGFDVRLVPNLLEFAENRGALNCMCKVVARGSAGA